MYHNVLVWFKSSQKLLNLYMEFPSVGIVRLEFKAGYTFEYIDNNFNVSFSSMNFGFIKPFLGYSYCDYALQNSYPNFLRLP